MTTLWMNGVGVKERFWNLWSPTLGNNCAPLSHYHSSFTGISLPQTLGESFNSSFLSPSHKSDPFSLPAHWFLTPPSDSPYHIFSIDLTSNALCPTGLPSVSYHMGQKETPISILKPPFSQVPSLITLRPQLTTERSHILQGTGCLTPPGCWGFAVGYCTHPVPCSPVGSMKETKGDEEKEMRETGKGEFLW